MNKNNLPVVAIIGRPNTGKSTLFNTIVNQKKAIVSEFAGTTRDNILAECEWNGKKFELVDTAGIIPDFDTEMEENIQAQAKEAEDMAEIIVFVVDIRTGPTPQEMELARRLRKFRKPVILAINKADGNKWREQAQEFDMLGMNDAVIISSIQGTGVGDLLDEVTSYMQKTKKVKIDKKPEIKVGIFGKPNAGKSSLINQITGENKSIVSETPNTTRDAIDIRMAFEDHDIILVDTAGIKKKMKTKGQIERFSIDRSLQVARDIDIAILVIDINDDLTSQDLRIAKYLVDRNKGILIAINKWDLIKKTLENQTELEKQQELTTYLRRRMAFINWAPIHFISAKNGYGVDKILDELREIKKERDKVVDPEKLKEVLRAAYKKYPPPRLGRKNPPEIKKLTQVGTHPPRFTVKIKDTVIIRRPYIKYLEKAIRREFGFKGTVIKVSTLKERL